MSADQSLFVFGHLATPEHLAAQARERLSGIWHGECIEPRDPLPDQPVHVCVQSGARMGVRRVVVRFTDDGSQPSNSSQVIEAQRVATDWSDLAWEYVDRWEATIPGRPDGTMIRYTVHGETESGEMIAADAGRPRAEASVFAFHVDRYRSPDWMRDTVIYQIFVDRFAAPGKDPNVPPGRDEVWGGTLDGIAEHLPYLQRLGVSALWLTPIFEAETYHAYDALDYNRVAERVGGTEGLRRLVSAAHERGIAVLLDLAPNHISWHNPAFLDARANPESRFRDWFTFEDWPDRYRMFFTSQGLPELNTRNPEVIKYLSDVATRYVREFDIDGFRLDYALGPPLSFWSQLQAALKRENPRTYTVAEATTGPGGLRAFEGRLDGVLDFPALQLFRQFFVDRSLDAPAFHSVLERADAFYGPLFSRPTFLDNHDMNRFLWVAGGDERVLRLAVACQMTLPQTPIIYYGTEVGLSQTQDVSEVGHAAARLPMIWDERQNMELFDLYRTLIDARRRHGALRRGSRSLISARGGVYAYLCEHAGDRVAVALNRDREERIVALPGVRGVDIVSGERVNESVTLPPLTPAVVELEPGGV